MGVLLSPYPPEIVVFFLLLWVWVSSVDVMAARSLPCKLISSIVLEQMVGAGLLCGGGVS